MEFGWDAWAPATTTITMTTGPTQIAADGPSRTALSLDNIDRCFCYLADYRVLICKEHATAVQNIDRHLLKQHGVACAGRKDLVEYCRRFPLAAPRDVEVPLPLGPPIEELGRPLDGLQCRCSGNCRFITVSIVKLQIHCKKEHGQAWKGDTSAL